MPSNILRWWQTLNAACKWCLQREEAGIRVTGGHCMSMASHSRQPKNPSREIKSRIPFDTTLSPSISSLVNFCTFLISVARQTTRMMRYRCTFSPRDLAATCQGRICRLWRCRRRSHPAGERRKDSGLLLCAVQDRRWRKGRLK